MKHNIIYTITAAVTALLVGGCTEDTVFSTGTTDIVRKEIRLQADIDQLNVSRADDSGFADGDRIGIYAVNFTPDGNPGTLVPSGNLADNVRFTFDEAGNSWSGDRQLYFKDEKTPVDFYGYYPYVDPIENVGAYPFSVQRNQSTEATAVKLSGYEASDFLWGKTAGVTASTPLVTVTFQHILASVQVTLIEGQGFDAGEWTTLDKSVLVTGTGRDALIDLSTGKTTLFGSADNTGIITARHGDDYRAVVIPQSVAAGEALLSITVDGQSYEFKKEEAFTYLQSKMHRFTIEVAKRMPEGDFEFSVVAESITPWESDSESHNGKVKEYVVVEVPEAGGLEAAVNAAGLNPDDLRNLKIKGEMTESDFAFLREKGQKITALNLKEVICRNCARDEHEGSDNIFFDYALPHDGCTGMRYLTSVVLPDKLVHLGEKAFRSTPLAGTINLPEGLEWIGTSAFDNSEDYTDTNSSLTGTLTLPTTLKFIGGSAFNNCDFTGPLILPEGLEEIGGGAFVNCRNMTGELHLPSSLKKIGEGAFTGMTGLSGALNLPHQFESIPNAFGGCNFTSISFPEDIVAIDQYAIAGLPLKGDLKIPESVKNIGHEALARTKLNHIWLPSTIERLEPYTLSGNTFLIDTVTIPSAVEIIETELLSGCNNLDAIILPKGIIKIKEGAFADCRSLTYLRCDATEPPEVVESAFGGINKDNFTVVVPEKSVDAYRAHPVWGEFRRVAAYRNFIARPSKINVLNKGGERDIVLNADGEWELVSIPEFCHIDKTSGSMKTQLKVTIDRMEHNQGNRSDSIVFRLKGVEDYETHINIGQYDYEHEEDSYLKLQAASQGRGIDVFFVGDGYDAADIAAGTYLIDMQQEMEYLFAVEPYTTYRDYFNVYTAFALSDDRGVEDVNHWRNTKFHSQISNSDTRLDADWMTAMDYCAAVCPPISGRENPAVGVVLVVNSDIYEGITYTVSGSDSFCSVVTKSAYDYPNDARGILQHEAGGHGFGWLADEYMYHRAFIHKCPCICCRHLDGLREDHSWGFGRNISETAKYRQVPWSHLIFNPALVDIVDIYEGGYFHSRGVYRSEYNSCMNNNVPYFSTWSRQLIVERIMKLAGKEFSLDSFYANDKRDMGRDFTSTSRSTAPAPAVRHGRAPVHVKGYTFGKKGGKK